MNSKLKWIAGVAVAAAVFVGGASLVSAETTKVIHVGDTNNSSLTDRQEECAAAGGRITSWHFVINGISSGSAKPGSILVTWDDGDTAVVPLDTTAGGAKVGHYTVAAPEGVTAVVDAEATISSSWSGQFVLSHVTCLIAKANVTLTKTVADGIDGPFVGTLTVCFTLSPASGSSPAEQCHDFTSGEQFTFAWNDLSVGDYTVLESVAPAGYGEVQPVSFSVRSGCTGSDPAPCFEAFEVPSTYDLGSYMNLPDE